MSAHPAEALNGQLIGFTFESGRWLGQVQRSFSAREQMTISECMDLRELDAVAQDQARAFLRERGIDPTTYGIAA